MDQQDHDNQNPAHPSPENAQNGDVRIPQTPDPLSDNPDDLKPLIFERDDAIHQLRQRNEELQNKLSEREKMVSALTSRLEQAAEQLDRLRRSGADRGGKLLSGIPAEVIDEQRELINDLKSAIHHWEDLQSTSAMGRFEAQLAELREMLAEQLNLKSKIDTGSSGSLLGSPSAPTSSGDSQPSGGGGSWDEMKARLLGDSEAPESSNESSDVMIPGAESPATPAQIPGSSEESPETTESDFHVEIRERPAAVESFDDADADTLRAAVTARDEHIDHLMDVIQQLKEQGGIAELEEAKQRQSELEEKLRKSEIEMSMERAKLAREETRLKQMEEELQHPSARKKNADAPKADEKEDKGNRWGKFLGSKE